MALRMSENELKRLGIKIPNSKKKSKYNAHKVKIDGILFDSTAEANYYSLLKIQVRAKKIRGFCRQARFVVIEGDDNVKATEYVTDFVVFNNDGTYRIVDVKGIKTEVFKLKMKSLYEKYPEIKIELER